MTSVDLQKRVEAAGISLSKAAARSTADLGDVSAQVTASIDFSGSMGSLYRSGVVQEVVERCLALTLTGLDPDGVVPVRFYDTTVYDVIEATEDTYVGLVDRFMTGHSMGGTKYSPVLAELLGDSSGKRKLFGKGKGQESEADFPPNLHLFFTDGEPEHADKRRIEQHLVEARNRPHFFQFVMLGRDQMAMKYLDHLNNGITGPGLDNVGVTVIADPAARTDEEFFDDIVAEFIPVWLPAARTAGVTHK